MANELKTAADYALATIVAHLGDTHHITRFHVPAIEDYIKHLESFTPDAYTTSGAPVAADVLPDSLGTLVDENGQPVDVPQGDIQQSIDNPSSIPEPTAVDVTPTDDTQFAALDDATADNSKSKKGK